MDVVFITLKAREALAFGIMSLAGALRGAGHNVQLVQGDDVQALARHPRVQAADVLAMSATTGLHRKYVLWARQLRRRFPDKALVMGGPHPTFFPEVIAEASLDGVCIGEGEESFPEFLEALAGGLRRVPPGWWIRRDAGAGAVQRGEERPPPLDLDLLSPPAYDILYGQTAAYRSAPNKAFLATRGCPYNCTYCFNRTLNQRYRKYGCRLRTRDPEALVDDIQEVRRRWGVKLTWFLDANFVAHRPWLEAFASCYRRRVGLPYMCKLRPERATARVVRTLVASNCTAVGVGLEAGSERLRRTVLGRPVSDQAILDGCRRLKAHGIRILAFNMLGIPGETLDEALLSVAFNVACGVDFGAATILQPYPGTEIARQAVADGRFDGDYDSLEYSYFSPSPLRFPSQRDRDRITNLQRLFSYAVEFPEVRRRLRALINRPPSELYRHLFAVRHSWAINHTFYRAFHRDPPRDAGRLEQLRQACMELGVGSGFSAETG